MYGLHMKFHRSNFQKVCFYSIEQKFLKIKLVKQKQILITVHDARHVRSNTRRPEESVQEGEGSQSQDQDGRCKHGMHEQPKRPACGRLAHAVPQMDLLLGGTLQGVWNLSRVHGLNFSAGSPSGWNASGRAAQTPSEIFPEAAESPRWHQKRSSASSPRPMARPRQGSSATTCAAS